MVKFIQDNGWMINTMVKVKYKNLMAMYTMDNGQKIK